MKITQALTFDDVLLVPQYSEITPGEVSLTSQFTRNITLQTPFISAAMDTVTEHEMAIAMALAGAIGVIHKNCTPEEQAQMVARVKRFENGFITDPMVVDADTTIAQIIQIEQEHGFSNVPVTENGNLSGKVLGMISRNDYMPGRHDSEKVSKRMHKIGNLLTTSKNITLIDAQNALADSRDEAMLILDKNGSLKALITRKDIKRSNDYPLTTKDASGNLRTAAAVGPAANMTERVALLASAGVDALVVDTAHGHSRGVIDTVKHIKDNYPDLEVIAGNIATAEAAKALIKVGVDALKVGIGPGSICTTRIVAGTGVPQLSAIANVTEIAQKANIPVIADGGIKYSGDAAKAFAVGASCVMMGSLLAGTAEAPGEMFYAGDGKAYKSYRGMGSLGAMARGGKERYGQANVAAEKFVPEGIEGRTLYKGPVSGELHQLCGGLRSAMGYSGAPNLRKFAQIAKLVQITGAGLTESHPHNITITKQSPNYRK